MLRSFVGALAAEGPAPDDGPLRAALAGEGDVQVERLGALAVAYTGGPRGRRGNSEPLCLLDGTVYELDGASPPARTGPELERVLAARFRAEEARLLPRLRGEFALLFFDPGSGRGLLARDHMGARGVVWCDAPGTVLVATETRPLIRALGRRPEPDQGAVAHWLSSRGLPRDRTLYAGVRRIEGGAALSLGDGEPRARRYWSPAPGGVRDGDPADHAAALRSALERAVERRIGPGESVGVLLSGGLDSGSVSALAAHGALARHASAAYSAVFPDHPSVDEADLIGELAVSLGLRPTAIRVFGGSVLEGALAYLNRFELPPVSPNLFFWNPLLRRAADDGVSVLLDGEGGDEVFGLSGNLLADRLRRGRLLSAVRLTGRIPGADRGLTRRQVAAYLRSYGVKGAVPFRLHDLTRRLRGAERYAPEWMRPEAAAALFASDDMHHWKRERGPRWFVEKVDRVIRGPGPALAYDHIRRRASLAGIEPRHPLVDPDVIELILRLPPELAFDPARSRPLFRESMKGLLPDAVRLRATKSNFDAVFHEALAGPDLPLVRALLGRPDARVGEWVDLSLLDDLIAGPPPTAYARMWWGVGVWRLVTTECWLLSQEGPEVLERRLGRPAAGAKFEFAPPVGG